jgi:hypothetical protein
LEFIAARCEPEVMSDADAAMLSSLTSTLDDLLARVGELAERYAAARQEGIAEELYAAERALGAARRAVVRAHAALR